MEYERVHAAALITEKRGNMTKDFVPVGKEEKAAELLGIDCEWMVTYFCKPKLKVGTEWVQKGSTCTNAANSVAGIARAIYERTFRTTSLSNPRTRGPWRPPWLTWRTVLLTPMNPP